MEEVYAQAARLPVVPELIPLRDFYAAPEFLDPAAALAKPLLVSSQADHVLFSFHGVPERQVTATKLGPAPCRFDEGCCAAINTSNRACYRAQSFATARALAERLGLQKDQWSVSFQSRLGRIPWIRPYTDEVVPELPKRGVKRLLVLCPSFTADCLETLEEMGILHDDVPMNWYDPVRFWSGDTLPLKPGWSYGVEVGVEDPDPSDRDAPR